jgi:hypothetical protein
MPDDENNPEQPNLDDPEDTPATSDGGSADDADAPDEMPDGSDQSAGVPNESQAAPRSDRAVRFTPDASVICNVDPVPIDNDGFDHYNRAIRSNVSRGRILDVLAVLGEITDTDQVIETSHVADRVGTRIGNSDWSQNNLSPLLRDLRLAGAVAKVDQLVGTKDPVILDERMIRDLAPDQYPAATAVPYIRSVKELIGSIDLRTDAFVDDDDGRSDESVALAPLLGWTWAQLSKFVDPDDSGRPREVGFTVHQFGGNPDNGSWTTDFPFADDMLYEQLGGRYKEYVTLIDITYHNVDLRDVESAGDAVIQKLLVFHAASLYGSNFSTMRKRLSHLRELEEEPIDKANGSGVADKLFLSDVTPFLDEGRLRVATYHRENKDNEYLP